MSTSNSTTELSPREQHGLAIAATRKITQAAKGWIVPSQYGNGRYTVSADLHHCTCPDHELRRVKCKHIYAVEYTLSGEVRDRKNAPVVKRAKITYRQDWPAYNAAQTAEKATLQVLLHDLCKGIQQPRARWGRHRAGAARCPTPIWCSAPRSRSIRLSRPAAS